MHRFGIGQPVRRVEDRRFLTGQSRYVDDLQLPQQAYGATLMSPHAHAHIRSVDVGVAQAAPGVLLVLTGSDVTRDQDGSVPPAYMPEDIGGAKGYRTFRPLLAQGRLRTSASELRSWLPTPSSRRARRPS